MSQLLLKSCLEVIGIILFVGTLPLILELLVLTVAALLPERTSTRSPAIHEAIKKLTVIIPCHNEEIYISRCLKSVLLSGGRDADVLLIAHNCTDKTLEMAKAFPEVRVHSFNDLSRRGKGFALEEGFRLTFMEGDSDAVLIVDADSIVSPNLIASVRRDLMWSNVLQCQYTVNNPDGNWRTGLLTLALQAMNIVRPKGRDRLSLSCGIFGNGFAIRKSVLTNVPYNSYSLVEDLEFHLSLVEEGYKVCFIDSAVVSAEMPTERSVSATQRARWEGGRIRILRSSGWKLFRRILSGRLEFAEPLLDLLSMPLAYAAVLLFVLTLVPNLFFRGYVACALLIILFHLYAAARVGPDFPASVRALLFVPFYIAWKMTMLTPIIRASQNGAEWVRTKRGSSRQ